MLPENKCFQWSLLFVAGQEILERTVSSPERIARHAYDVADEEAQEGKAGLPEVEVVVVAEDEGEGLFGGGRVSCLFG